ncbi:peptidylprolyl isomerase [Lysinibacillus sphaericus]|uniref:Peptidylprolyl isomerase n=1 Tax=Lysinibacillus sphaericus TaxID=1421 RepID=A0A544UJV4_LYSSH|nr:peptidylprolyl isomerase [Lysinibacillus sp. SDF0037]TQR33555.1 peptidylprolyl isomerase [Lysinibacillus sp. SDF0037]
MKKLLFLVFLTVFILTACNSSTLSISEIESVPEKVQKVIDEKNTLQLINEVEKDVSYIVFQSKGTVTTGLETEDDTLIIKLDVTNQQDNEIKQHVYKLTFDSNLDTINIHINGKSTTIDNVTGI